jgi:hypothetical protein
MTVVAALRDQWQAARLQRQQELAQRRADVQADLSHYQTSRERNTAELQQRLAEYYASVQDETNLYLAQVQQQRQTQAKRTAKMLQEFDAELKAAVALLRADNRQDLDTLRLATQATLAAYERDRADMGRQQQQELMEFVDELAASVADYLAEIAENRQVMAVADQAQRHRDREALTDEVQLLRDEFTLHRQQLQAFRESLRQLVWGDSAPTVGVKTPAVPVPAKSSPVKTVPQATDRNRRSENGRPPSTAATLRRSRAQAKPVDTTKADDKSMPDTEPQPVTPSKLSVSHEEAVFEYLQSHDDGARLTDIESTLGLNRFQAVDALRSLIQKELIVQKDRTYRIQEEVVL